MRQRCGGPDVSPPGRQESRMKVIRAIAVSIVGLAGALSVGADWLAPHDYAEQFRDRANEPPSRTFPLGTDELGRDRFSRLLQGSRISLFCAPVAALIATAIATSVGLIAGYLGGWVDTVLTSVTDLCLSLPWFFALLTLRALLPLNVSSWVSLAATFILLAAVGWPSCARVVRAGTAAMRSSGSILHARACGCRDVRLLFLHVLPNLRPILSAQFWILVPVFLLAEANLGMLGLGVTEPMPSLGNMLVELQHYEKIPESPWILAPAVLLVSVVASLHFVVSGRNAWE
jgi:ABC-type dipeptide/oligopeptide/nickel transport system permease subunit